MKRRSCIPSPVCLDHIDVGDVTLLSSTPRREEAFSLAASTTSFPDDLDEAASDKDSEFASTSRLLITTEPKTGKRKPRSRRSSTSSVSSTPRASSASISGKRVKSGSKKPKSSSRADLYQLPALPSQMIGRSRHLEPVINGMKNFGIGKSGISRAVVKFTEPPTQHPCTVCFHFPATSLTHRYVLDLVRTNIHFVQNAKVVSIQYIDRNTILGTRGMDNRWLITVNTTEARDELMRLGLHMNSRHIILRRYDDVLQDEYKEYLEYIESQKRLYVRLQQMAQMQQDVNVQPSAHLQSVADELKRALSMKQAYEQEHGTLV